MHDTNGSVCCFFFSRQQGAFFCHGKEPGGQVDGALAMIRPLPLLHWQCYVYFINIYMHKTPMIGDRRVPIATLALYCSSI